MYVFWALSFVILASFRTGSGHRYGADPMACDTMKPGHGSNVRQTRHTPYIIDTNMDGYVPCDNQQQQNCGVLVRIRGRIGATNGGQFKGFLLQARTKTPEGVLQYVGEYRYVNGQPVVARNNANQINGARMSGQFGGNFNPIGGDVPMALGQVGPPGFPGSPGVFPPGGGPNAPFPGNNGPFPGNTGAFPGNTGFPANTIGGINSLVNSNVMVQRMQCVRGTAVTHTENNIKNVVSLIWIPPMGFNQPVEFVATVVQDYNTFWMGHRSKRLNARPALRNRPGGIASTARFFSVAGASHVTSGFVVVLMSLVSLLFVML
ncbi:uncharacterized protein LOC127854429 [Dreissena polymorpha]|uniref:Reelin domain-containing protein n=1 Tax=Dreissena polymorpha TaxID=45954 RepID=A0A9D4C877_DREPO|nr:uncharacterized protein LOC127854429 [Dreissena polymorpha]KAH3719258.1 hypothetical protein DPMN_062090 [Dreissena polymorpha]